MLMCCIAAAAGAWSAVCQVVLLCAAKIYRRGLLATIWRTTYAITSAIKGAAGCRPADMPYWSAAGVAQDQLQRSFALSPARA
jgi:hypothetical protein